MILPPLFFNSNWNYFPSMTSPRLGHWISSRCVACSLNRIQVKRIPCCVVVGGAAELFSCHWSRTVRVAAVAYVVGERSRSDNAARLTMRKLRRSPPRFPKNVLGFVHRHRRKAAKCLRQGERRGQNGARVSAPTIHNNSFFLKIRIRSLVRRDTSFKK